MYFLYGWATICVPGIVLLATGGYSELLWTVLFIPGALAATVGITRAIRKMGNRLVFFSRPFGERPVIALLLVLPLTGAFFTASLPPDSRDELTYHLLLPQQWALSGNWDQAPGNPVLLFPADTEILFSWARTIGGEGSARFLALAAALLCLSLLLEEGKTAAGRLMVLCFIVLTPMMLLTMSTAYVEYFLALLILLGWKSAMESSPGTAGLAWGLALGVKYTAIPLVGFFLIESLFKLGRRRNRERRILMGSFLVATVVLAAPWYLRNFQLRDDPIHPFGSLISSDHSSRAADAEVMTDFSPIPPGWRLFPWLYHSVNNPLADETLHPLWVLLIPGVVFLGFFRRDLPWFSVTGMAVFFLLSRPACRVMLPAMLPACLWLPSLFDRVTAKTWNSLISTVTFFFLAFFSLPFVVGQWVVIDKGEATRYLTGEISAEKYLEVSGTVTPVMQFVASQTAPDTRIWLWGEDRALYLRRWAWPDYPYRTPTALKLAGQGDAALNTAVEQWNIDYVLVSREAFSKNLFCRDSSKEKSLSVPEKNLRNWMLRHTMEEVQDRRFRLFRLR